MLGFRYNIPDSGVRLGFANGWHPLLNSTWSGRSRCAATRTLLPCARCRHFGTA